MKKIVICEAMDATAVASLQGRFEVVYDPNLVDRADALQRAVADADAWIVRNRTQVRGGLLAAAARLRVVGRLGVGLDNIDMIACRARGIEVIPASGANALAVAEYVVGTIMLLLRGVHRASADVALGRWPREALSEGREIAGKTLGIVGFGSIGRTTGRLARALGMRVIGTDVQLPGDSLVWPAEQTEPRALDELLAEADAVTLHVPLLEQTRNLFDAKRLARMKPGAILVNTARGGIVDESALLAALASGYLSGAALDVFAVEPLAASHEWADAVAKHPNLILTPHIAGISQESNLRVSVMIAERVADVLSH